MTTKILVVEDDEAMAVALADGFSFEGYRVEVARDGQAGLELACEMAPDLIVLDVMLPKKNGMDVARELRNRGDGVPIIMLTARGQEIDKVLGLRTGADDYVTKPFSFMELLARVEAVLRRSGSANSAPESHSFGDVRIDFRRHEAEKGGEALDLSAREFQLLEYFVRHRGEAVSRDRLLDDVWGYDSIPFTRTVDTHVAKLRKKIEDLPSEPRYLLTVHRVGYKFVG